MDKDALKTFQVAVDTNITPDSEGDYWVDPVAAMAALGAMGYTITKISEAREPKPWEWWLCRIKGEDHLALLFSHYDGSWSLPLRTSGKNFQNFHCDEVTPIRPIDMSLPEKM